MLQKITILNMRRYKIPIIFCCLFLIYILLVQAGKNSYSDNNKNIINGEVLNVINSVTHSYIDDDDTDMKNILMWTHNFTEPFNLFKSGREVFVNSGCKYSNCYVTNNRSYMKNINDWNAILFHAPEYTWPGNPWHHGTPNSRDARQIYIYSSIESSANYPVIDSKWDSYFNWTMTYRIDSDIPWLYFNILDMNDNIIGPAKNIKWIADTENAISDAEKQEIKSKNKAVAWFVSNCKTKSKREEYASKLNEFLNKMQLSVDIYGSCGSFKCSIENNTSCWKELKEKYYFYLSFENSFSEDYVTEKFLHAMAHRLVPIVWGGSNYSKFAPPNSYINARNHSPEELAKIISSLINNHEDYIKYFNWSKNYKYINSYSNPKTNTFCTLCEALNKQRDEVSNTYTNFRKWWNK